MYHAAFSIPCAEDAKKNNAQGHEGNHCAEDAKKNDAQGYERKQFEEAEKKISRRALWQNTN